MSFVTDHHGRHDLSFECADSKQIEPNFGFPKNVFPRIVLRMHEPATHPEIHHRGFVFSSK